MLWSNEKYEIKNDGNYQSISINNKIYSNIFRDTDLDIAWGLAAKYFYLMLADQLEIQGSVERIYPMSGGNDGQFLILTKEQFEYIISIGLQKEWEPMEL